MPVTYSGPLNDKGVQEERQPLCAQTLCSGDKGRELHCSYMFRSVPKIPPGYDRYPKAVKYGPVGRPFPSGTAAPLESAAEAKRRT